MYKSLILIIFIVATLLTSGCKDDFAKLNTDPASLPDPNIPYLVGQGILTFEPANYLFWYYNASYITRWIQSYVPISGNTDKFNIMGASGNQGTQALAVLRYIRDIDNAMEKKPEESAQYAQMRAFLNPLVVYLALFDSDVYGAICFSEAAMAPYGGTLTPKYDTVQELYAELLAILDQTLDTFANPSVKQTIVQSQDPIYNGNIAKWAKFTNSLKLKIAVRLLHQDKAQALKIAEEVANHSAGILNGIEDDLFLNRGIYNYHFNDNVLSVGAGSKPVIDFMVSNLDPRVRFVFAKNMFNSNVVQAFFDDERDNPGSSATLPAYILANVNYTEESDGHKVFRSWKGAGEPWIRYYGIPSDMGAATQASVYGDYFEETRWKIGPSDGQKTYTPYAIFNQETQHGQPDYTIPTVPGGPVIEDKTDMSWWGMYLTTAEVNLYLAELKLLGANLPNTAAEYFNKAMHTSVEAYDHISRLNKIPYYGTTYDYDPNEVEIDLKSGEIEAMLANPAYQLTGSATNQLEKVYIQEYLHFLLLPTDQYVTVRRSGIPKVGSSLIAWNPISANTQVPRRFDVAAPSPTDLMYQNTSDIYKQQGFTPSSNNNPSLLNSERLWQDIGAPNYGEGPNF